MQMKGKTPTIPLYDLGPPLTLYRLQGSHSQWQDGDEGCQTIAKNIAKTVSAPVLPGTV